MVARAEPAMKIGYLISSQVFQNHAIIPPLLESLWQAGVQPEQVLVSVVGSEQPYRYTQRGVRFFFAPGNFTSHFLATLEEPETHWFFINGTSRAGPKFKELVEGGFNPDVDVTLAGGTLVPGKISPFGRAINDLAMYRADFLRSKTDYLKTVQFATLDELIQDHEGALFAMSQRQAVYPRIGWETSPPQDIYGTGTPRITEYYPGIDWYRYKKNWGQIKPPYDTVAL